MVNYEINPAHIEDLHDCLHLLKSSVMHMRASGFTQWDDEYPNRDILQKDIESGHLYVIRCNHVITGFAAFDRNQSPEYSVIDFQFPPPSMFVHRLCIDPSYQRMGLADALMQFAFLLARDTGCRSIRLDTRADNHAALRLYENLGFQIRGHVHFPRCPEYEFPCMEIQIGND